MRFLPHTIAATFFVLVLPSLVLTLAGPDGPTWAVLLSVLAAMAASVGLATLGSAVWMRHPAPTTSSSAISWCGAGFERLAPNGGSRGARPARGGPGALDGADAETRRELLEKLSAALEARDAYTHGHTKRVTRHSERVAREMGLAPELVAKIRIAAAVHDVGKINTPREVLTKPGRLDDVEFEAIKRHPVDGAEMVREIGDAEITAMVRHHHERLDGTGYPDRLAGDEIPLGARIIAVADTFDAMTSSRPYRTACSHKRALDVLTKEAGAQLDPAPVAAFMRYYSGKRSVGWTALAVAVPQRLGAWIGAAFQNAGAGIAPAVQGLAAVGAAGVMGAGLGAGGEAASAKVVRQEAVQATSTSVAGRRDAEDGGTTGGADQRRAADDRGSRGGSRRRERDVADGRDGNRGGTPDAGPRGGGPGDGPAGGGRGEEPDRGGSDGSPGGGGGSTPSPGGDDDSERPVTVPDVGVPKVEEPPVELGPIDVPVVETPTIEVPEVEIPPIEVGPIKTPGIKTPGIRVPGL